MSARMDLCRFLPTEAPLKKSAQSQLRQRELRGRGARGALGDHGDVVVATLPKSQTPHSPFEAALLAISLCAALLTTDRSRFDQGVAPGPSNWPVRKRTAKVLTRAASMSASVKRPWAMASDAAWGGLRCLIR
jgi:hypothetical protein